MVAKSADKKSQANAKRGLKIMKKDKKGIFTLTNTSLVSTSFYASDPKGVTYNNVKEILASCYKDVETDKWYAFRLSEHTSQSELKNHVAVSTNVVCLELGSSFNGKKPKADESHGYAEVKGFFAKLKLLFSRKPAFEKEAADR